MYLLLDLIQNVCLHFKNDIKQKQNDNNYCVKSGTNDLFNTTIPLFKKKETQKSFIKYILYNRKVPADNMSTNKRRGAFTL